MILIKSFYFNLFFQIELQPSIILENRYTLVQKRGAIGFILTMESLEIGKYVFLGV